MVDTDEWIYKSLLAEIYRRHCQHCSGLCRTPETGWCEYYEAKKEFRDIDPKRKIDEEIEGE